jgi:hypothetical protein
VDDAERARLNEEFMANMPDFGADTGFLVVDMIWRRAQGESIAEIREAAIGFAHDIAAEAAGKFPWIDRNRFMTRIVACIDDALARLPF